MISKIIDVGSIPAAYAKKKQEERKMKLKLKTFDSEAKLNAFLSKNSEYKMKRASASYFSDKIVQTGDILVDSITPMFRPTCKSTSDKTSMSGNLLFVLKYFELTADEKKAAIDALKHQD